MQISIPGYRDLDIQNIVFDYNGTLANGGVANDEIKASLESLSRIFSIYVITADTFGTVKEELKELNLEVVVLKSSNHTQEKANFIKELGVNKTISIGNGNNDKEMLKNAVISIAVIGNEGCSTEALLSSNIVVNSIKDAIDILTNSKKMVATLRC